MRENVIIRLTEGELKQMINESVKSLLLEYYGVFEGCEQLADDILYGIIKYWNNETKEYPSLRIYAPWAKCGFLVIRKGQGNFNAAYGSHPSEEIPNVIFINPSILSSSAYQMEMTVMPSLMHELTHAYHDAMLHKKGMSWGELIKDTGYINVYGYYIERHGQKSIMKDDISQCLYTLSEIEKRSWVAAMYGKLEYQANSIEFENVNDIVEFLKGTREYNKIMNSCYIVEEILTKYDKEEKQQSVIDIVNGFTNYGFNTYNQVCKYLLTLSRKSKMKVEEMLPKIAWKYWKDEFTDDVDRLELYRQRRENLR